MIYYGSPSRLANQIVDWSTDLRPVSTQENKHRIGLDFFPSCIIRTAGPKKVEKYYLGCGSQVQVGTENWYFMLIGTSCFMFNFVPIPCFCSEWKLTFVRIVRMSLYLLLITCRNQSYDLHMHGNIAPFKQAQTYSAVVLLLHAAR